MNSRTDDSAAAEGDLSDESIREFVGATAVDEVYEAVLQSTRDRLDPDYCMVASVEDGDYEIRTHHIGSRLGGFDNAAGLLEDLSGPGSCDVILNTYTRGVAERCPDVMKTRSASADAASNRTAIRSVMAAPVDEWGVLLVGSTQPNDFSEADLQFAEGICSIAVVALNRIGTTDADAEFYRHLIRTVLHDIRSPLNVALGHVELARTESANGGDHLDRIETSLGRIGELLDRVQQIDRTGQILDRESAVDIGAVADRVWKTIETADATLETSPVTCIADELALRQVLENLLRNAIEHGGNDVTIRIGPLAPGDGFYVQDDGRGIDPAIRDDIFSVGTSSRNGGNGIGLAIVERLVSAHGWTIRALEAESGGARFEITDVTTA